MKNSINKIVFTILISYPIILFGQTGFINTGDFIVSPETVVSVFFDAVNSKNGSFINDGEIHFHKNLTNYGSLNFSETSGGLAKFIGNSVQTISGSEKSYFYNVEFNNLSDYKAFVLKSDIQISGKANFLNGIVEIPDELENILFFDKGATHLSVSDYSHVDGKVRKIGNSKFTFPIGDNAYYRMAIISSPDDNEDHFTSQYHYNNTNHLFPHESKEPGIKFIEPNEYWTVNRTGGNSNVILSISWNNATSSDKLLNDPDKIHIVRWDEEEQMWIDEGGVVDKNVNTVTTVSPLSKYGVFTFGYVDQEVNEEIVVYDIFTPNNDGINEQLRIDNIDQFPNNSLQIYNRWGRLVFETEGYGQNDNYFKGYSSEKATIKRKEQLPVGTYYYILRYVNKQGKEIRKVGGIYISR